MQEITFPGLQLTCLIDRVAFRIGKVEIYWYGILLLLSCLTAILLLRKETKNSSIRFDTILEMGIILLPSSILGARIYYVLFRLDYYLQNPWEILNLRNGGLAIFGGILGAVISLAIYCKKRKINLLQVLDLFAPCLALGQAIGRWGNFFNGEAYGVETKNMLRMGILENGIYKEVHPTFLYESICDILLFCLLYQKRKKKAYDGQITYLYLTFYSLARIGIEGLRTDSLMLGNVKISQVVSIVLFVIFGIVLLVPFLRKVYRKKKEQKQMF